MCFQVQRPDEHSHRECGTDGGDGDIARGHEDQEPEGEGDAHAQRGESHQHACAGGNTLAALEAQEAGPIVPGYGHGTAEDRQDIFCKAFQRGGGQGVRQEWEECCAAIAFEEIEGKGEDSQLLADRAEYVCCANVTTANRANINPLCFGNKEAKGNGSHQISDCS